MKFDEPSSSHMGGVRASRMSVLEASYTSWGAMTGARKAAATITNRTTVQETATGSRRKRYRNQEFLKAVHLASTAISSP